MSILTIQSRLTAKAEDRTDQAMKGILMTIARDPILSKLQIKRPTQGDFVALSWFLQHGDKADIDAIFDMKGLRTKLSDEFNRDETEKFLGQVARIEEYLLEGSAS